MAKGGVNLGVWAFVIGLILAAVIALIGQSTTESWVVITLAILGVIVGFFNVTGVEVQRFLTAAIAFLLSFSSLAVVFSGVFTPVAEFFQLMSVFMAPAAAIVAIQALYYIARD